VRLEEAAVFILEGDLLVMFLLVRYVGTHLIGFRFADGEDTVAGLPVELGKHWFTSGLVDEPDGGGALHFLHPIRDSDRAGEPHQYVNVIRDATDDQWLAFQPRGDAAEVVVEFVTQRWVGEKGKSFLRGPHGVDQDVRERLRHGAEGSENQSGTSMSEFAD
jgi:hypothetical protein